MKCDYDRLFEVLLASVANSGSIRDRIHAVIEECKRQRPHPDWDLFRDIDFSADQPRLELWLRSVMPAPSAAPVRGLWFSIGNYLCEDGTETADIYVRSTRCYDPESTRWFSDTEQEDNLLDSVVLAQIYGIAYKREQGLGNNAEYPLTLAYGAIVAVEAIRALSPAEDLGSLEGAVAGFHDGDTIDLGRRMNGRFTLDVRLP